MQSGDKKREPTLMELMAAQGKLSKKPQQGSAQRAQPVQKAQPAPKPQPVQKAQPAPKARTEEEKKRQAAELAKSLGAQMSQKQGPSKEDKLREMINADPAKAAELLREMFLKGD